MAKKYYPDEDPRRRDSCAKAVLEQWGTFSSPGPRYGKPASIAVYLGREHRTVVDILRVHGRLGADYGG